MYKIPTLSWDFFIKKIYIFVTMSRDAELKKAKSKEIRDFFNKLNDKKDCGVKMYTTAYCVALTANKFFIRPKTAESYIYA